MPASAAAAGVARVGPLSGPTASPAEPLGVERAGPASCRRARGCPWAEEGAAEHKGARGWGAVGSFWPQVVRSPCHSASCWIIPCHFL